MDTSPDPLDGLADDARDEALGIILEMRERAPMDFATRPLVRRLAELRCAYRRLFAQCLSDGWTVIIPTSGREMQAPAAAVLMQVCRLVGDLEDRLLLTPRARLKAPAPPPPEDERDPLADIIRRRPSSN